MKIGATVRRLVRSLCTASGLMLVMLACGGGGGGGSTPPPPPPAPSISSFAAAQTQVVAGASTTLTAVFSNGTGSVDQGIGTIQSGVALSTGNLTTTKTFTLTVSGSGGTATSLTTVTVIQQPSITSFIPTSSSISSGSSTTLLAIFSNGLGTIDQGVGAVLSGVAISTGNLTATKTFTLTVTGASGTTPVTAQTIVTVTTGTQPRTVTGNVTYDYVPVSYNPVTHVGGLNFAGATQRPVRTGVVQVFEGSTLRQSTSTDNTGHYSVTFTPAGTGQLAVVAFAVTTSPSILVQDNTSGNAVWGMFANLSPSDTTRDLHATHGWNGTSYTPSARLAGPFAILDTMLTASRAFLAVRPAVVFPELKVNWSPDNVPQSGNVAAGQIGTSHFSPASNQLFILGKDGVDTDEFDSHVMVHEWGHFFEHNLSRSDSPGGPHSNGDILDPRLAFGEGYGNGLSGILLYPDTIYADTLWNSGTLRAFGFDVDTEPTPSDDPTMGPFSETTVMRVLYHVFHTGVAGAGWDGVGVGLGAIYDVLTGPEKTTDAVTTIGSFITGLKAQPGVNSGAVNTLLAHFNIGPITTQWGDGDPNLKGMFTSAASLPYSGTIGLGGGFDSNKWQQNQYYVVTGNGAQVTVSTICAQDVDIEVFKSGVSVVSATSSSGNETVHFNTQAGVKYVVVITGYGSIPGNYNVTVNITSP